MDLEHKIWFDGVCSTDLDVVVSGEKCFTAAERDVTLIDVPGRSGSLVIDNGRYKNCTIQYPAFCRDFINQASSIRTWLTRNTGYCRLQDSYDPDCFRLARCVGPIEFSPGFLNRTATFEMLFDCKPQRYYLDGENAVRLSVSGRIRNRTSFPALPLVTVSGSGEGSLTIGERTVTILSLDGSLTLDSDTKNAYKGTENKNSAIRAAEFPVLNPGENEISWTGGVTGVEIMPRWWTL